MFTHLQLNIEQEFKKANDEVFQLSVQTEFSLDNNIIGVYGNSGQGKSTLLKVCAGIMSATDSVVCWKNERGSKQVTKEAEANPAVYQPQEVTLFEHLTVLENLRFVQQHSIWSTQQFTLQQVVSWCGVEGLLEQKAISLSGGEKQRVGLARSLLSGKPVVILDEPFSALDWNNRINMLKLIKKLNQTHNLAFIIVSHSLQELALCCDYLINIEQGKIAIQGTIDSVIQALSLASSEPVFSRIKINNHTYLADYHLTKWQLTGDSKQHIYIKQIDKSFIQPEVQVEQIVTIEANKVSLTRKSLDDTSMLNQLVGEITSIQPFQHLVLVSINVDGQELLSLISQLSYEKLELALGQTIFAQFKAV